MNTRSLLRRPAAAKAFGPAALPLSTAGRRERQAAARRAVRPPRGTVLDIASTPGQPALRLQLLAGDAPPLTAGALGSADALIDWICAEEGLDAEPCC